MATQDIYAITAADRKDAEQRAATIKELKTPEQRKAFVRRWLLNLPDLRLRLRATKLTRELANDAILESRAQLRQEFDVFLLSLKIARQDKGSKLTPQDVRQIAAQYSPEMRAYLGRIQAMQERRGA